MLLLIYLKLRIYDGIIIAINEKIGILTKIGQLLFFCVGGGGVFIEHLYG